MSVTRTRKNHLAYARFTKRAKKHDCAFCNLPSPENELIKSLTNFWIIKNLFPYDTWDSTGVNDHLMVIPKRHIDAIGHFTKKEQAEYAKILGEYDQKGYSVYARAPGNIIKSVVHQHTHLIALDNKPKRILVYIKNPRLLLLK